MERQKKLRFALIGCGGYVAPRHMKAIKDTENDLVLALDKSDSVGILDRYFGDVEFFTEFERFDRHAEKIKRNEKRKIDYVSICSPNYLHDAHIRFALRIGASAICEKPLVINPWNLEELEELEEETGKKVYTILQLRLHPSVISLKNKVEKEGEGKKYDVDLKYVAPRGNWYLYSWKGDEEKSGGLATNLGIHFFDMLIWVFGKVKSYTILHRNHKKMSGILELEKANVKWDLSIDKNDLPPEKREKSSSFRSLKINEEEFDFSDGFEDLHTKSYEEILNGKGFVIKDSKDSIKLAYNLRNASLEKKYIIEQ